MLVTREPHRREVPHEEGAWFDICKLSWKQLKKARKAATVDNADTARAFGGEIVKALQSDRGAEEAARLIRKQRYDESTFDTETLLLAGVVGWSHDKPVNAATVGDIDERTTEWLKREIIDLNKPPSEEE